MNAVLIGVLLYVVAQLAIGIAVSKRMRTESDYLLAGRSLGFGLATFTMFATWFGAETCVGAAGVAYAHGVSGLSAEPFAYAAVLVVMGLVFAAPLWRRKFTTIADLLSERFSGDVERIGVLLMAPTSVMWAAAQIRAFGQVVAATSTWPVSVGITVAATVVVFYTVSGGLLADAVTDLVQGVALAIGLVVVLFTVVSVAGGWHEVIAHIPKDEVRLLGPQDGSWLHVVEAWSIPLFGSLMTQELVGRVLATRSPEVARRSSIAAGGFYLVIGVIPLFLGLVGIGLVPNLAEPEQVLAVIAQKHLSTVLYILFAGALVSAILSTVDSALLAAASLVSHNLILPLRPRTTERNKVMIARAMVIVLGIVAYVLALKAEGVHDLVENASALGSAGVFVVVMFGLFTRFGGAGAALSALVAGIVVWVVGTMVPGFDYPYLASFVVSLFAYVGVAVAGKVLAAVRPGTSGA